MRTVRRGSWARALVLGMALAAPATGADFEAGERAWVSGRLVEAVAAWRSAAEAGDGRSMLAVGRAYTKGLGAPRDFVEAHKWLNLAAGFGVAGAVAERDALAGEMTAEERAEAHKLTRAWRIRAEEELRRQAEAGDGRSMLVLGRVHAAKGLGAPRDFVEAHKWLNLAAGFGVAGAVAERDALVEEMTAEERAKARKLARTWRSRAAAQRAEERLRQVEEKARRRREIEMARRQAEAERRAQQAEADRRRQEDERARREFLAREQRRLEQERKAILAKALEEYIGAIQSSVARNWVRPIGVPLGLKCTVNVVQAPNGEVLRVEIAQSSGNIAFDRSVEQAVRAASPLPRPRRKAVFEREIVFLFDPGS